MSKRQFAGEVGDSLQDDIVARLRVPKVEPCTCIWGDVVKKGCQSCNDRIDAWIEIERLRALMTAFVSAWERSELGENNGSEYFNAVHLMRKAVRGE